MTLVDTYHALGGSWQAYGREATITATYLPFDLPVYDGTEPKVLAHYFTQFWRRGAGSTPNTYADTYWMPPGAVEGTRDHRISGGFVRDWHLFEADPPTTGDYGLYDAKMEVREAIAAGIDMWAMNVLALTGGTTAHWARIVKMAQAVVEVNAEDGTDFRMMMMPDGVAGATTWGRDPAGSTVVDVNLSADILADHIYDLVTTYPDAFYYDEDDDLVIGPFGGEKVPTGGLTKTTGGDFTTADRPAFWRRFRDRLEDPADELSKVPISIKLQMCCVDPWYNVAATWEALDPTLVDAWGRWGERDVVASSSTSISNRDAARYCWDTYGKPWMHFVAPMDSRPANDGGTTYRTWEGLGSRQFDASWRAAIGEGGYRKSHRVQITTWNDYTENAHVNPSRSNGYFDPDGMPVSIWGDLNHYYVAAYKTGKYPTVKRDACYLFHRRHRSDHAWDAASLQTRRSTKGGSTNIADVVETLVFLTEAGDVQVLLDTGSGPSLIATHSAPVAGVHSFHTELPSGSGTLSARVVRDGSTVEGTEVTSRHSLRGGALLYDDYLYYAAGSLREAQEA